jgi:hypothetical protein
MFADFSPNPKHSLRLAACHSLTNTLYWFSDFPQTGIFLAIYEYMFRIFSVTTTCLPYQSMERTLVKSLHSGDIKRGATKLEWAEGGALRPVLHDNNFKKPVRAAPGRVARQKPTFKN